MIEKVYETPEIYKIDVPLPDNPLQNLNCYIVKSGQDTLMIDTGFNRPECMKAIKDGLAQLNVKLEQTSLFLTHLHSDHTGLAYVLMKDVDSPIYMSEVDYGYFKNTISGDGWTRTEQQYEKEGLPKEYTTILRDTNPARSFAPSGVFDAIALQDGDKIKVGEVEFTCILVPGHTPGQMCLYLEKEQLMFTADHILFDITPNITNWLGVPDSLGNYLESLKKIKMYPIRTAFPAHRKNDRNVYDRIHEIQVHHRHRLENTIAALAKNPGMNSYEAAAHLKWSMRGKCWEEFPVSQRWFAMGETTAHLHFLAQRGIVKCHEGKLRTYSLTQPLEKCMELLNAIEIES